MAGPFIGVVNLDISLPSERDSPPIFYCALECRRWSGPRCAEERVRSKETYSAALHTFLKDD